MPVELHGAVSAGDVFERAERKIGAMDGIVGSALLDAAADHGQASLFRRAQIQIEAPRGHDIRGEEFGGGSDICFQGDRFHLWVTIMSMLTLVMEMASL